jgi:hypothetical protein
MYVVQSAPCYQRQSLLHEYDGTYIRYTLQSILNVQLSDEAWCQATLPVSLGGLGIQSASDLPLLAFLSSVTRSATLTCRLLLERFSDVFGLTDFYYISALNEWKVKNRASEHAPPLALQQKAWDEPLTNVTAENVLSATQTQVGRARLYLRSQRHMPEHI